MNFFLCLLLLFFCACKEAIPRIQLLAASKNPISVDASQFNFVDGQVFENHYSSGGNYYLFTYENPSLTCPDQRASRFRVLVPKNFTANSSPLVLVYHGGIYDSERGGFWGGSHISNLNKLSAVWAKYNMDQFLGISGIEINEGGIASALIKQGWAGLFLENCWADMGFNRTYGDHLNDTSLENFKRAGLEASEQLLTYFYSLNIFTDFYSWGVSSGGHAAFEIAFNKSNIISKVVMDSPSDYILGYYDSIDYLIDTLQRFPTELRSTLYSTTDHFFLRVFKSTKNSNPSVAATNSLYYQLNQNNTTMLNKKIYFLYSSLDPVVPIFVTSPAATVMQNHITQATTYANNFCIKKFTKYKHVFSNDNETIPNNIATFLNSGVCL